LEEWKVAGRTETTKIAGNTKIAESTGVRRKTGWEKSFI
jgi:hypothetical protein